MTALKSGSLEAPRLLRVGISMDTDVQANLASVLARIGQAAGRSRRDPAAIRLVAVTKTVSEDVILEAVQAGVDCIAENYVQDARRKKERIGSRVQWHLIGHLQKNKAKQAIGLFDVIETVDDEFLAVALERFSGETGKVLDVLVQVNLSRESSKSGAPPENVLPLMERICGLRSLRCVGLMTLPPYFEDAERTRPYFSALRKLRDELAEKGIPGPCLRELSMGMSSDFDIAIEEGATIVRVGTALFGARKTA